MTDGSGLFGRSVGGRAVASRGGQLYGLRIAVDLESPI